MDSLAEEEQTSPMKKQKKVDEEEEIFSDTHVPELGCKPQWDVDSYDGCEYESDPDDSKLFSDDEEYEKYRLERRRAFDSKGFIYEPLSGNYPIKDLDALVYNNVTIRELMTDLANLCVKKLNETKEKTVELVDIVRVIVLGGGTRKAYITFMARESLNGPLVEYQAKVVTYANDLKPPFPILCRPSSIPSI
ncbi:unnamed protein product [Eruca vesicaria subsp. sativa]|uniref:Uncharacterized protein n=1 Tax=Eruca vesicaria subsp. sativa TaxID=29727 RepID=A0ABC8JLX6_ERUVS|nr:unnamed protein product [Eruca vesicaria subsp. sativa]